MDNNMVRYEPLPNDLFLVRVPMVATYTQEEIDLVGLPMDCLKDGEYYRNTYRELSTVMLTLDRIIDIYCNGWPIYVVQHEDTVKMHEILENYLRGVISTELTPVLNTGNNELVDDRLPYIEKFAEEMFNLNKGMIVKSMVQPINANAFTLGLDVIKGMKKVPTKENTGEVTIAQPNNYIEPNNTVDNELKNKRTNDYTFVYETTPEIDFDSIKRIPTKQSFFTKIK